MLLLIAMLIIISCNKDDDDIRRNDDKNESGKTIELYCKISPSFKEINGNGGSFYITVNSNTSWTAELVGDIRGIEINTNSGYNNGSVKVSYDPVQTKYWDENASVYFYYYDHHGKLQFTRCYVYRKHVYNGW